MVELLGMPLLYMAKFIFENYLDIDHCRFSQFLNSRYTSNFKCLGNYVYLCNELIVLSIALLLFRKMCLLYLR